MRPLQRFPGNSDSRLKNKPRSFLAEGKLLFRTARIGRAPEQYRPGATAAILWGALWAGGKQGNFFHNKQFYKTSDGICLEDLGKDNPHRWY